MRNVDIGRDIVNVTVRDKKNNRTYVYILVIVIQITKLNHSWHTARARQTRRSLKVRRMITAGQALRFTEASDVYSLG